MAEVTYSIRAAQPHKPEIVSTAAAAPNARFAKPQSTHLSQVPDVTGLAEPGDVFNGYMTAKSTVELNRANEQLSRAQALLAMQQAIEVQVKREQLKHERPATVGILRDMASAEHQPLFADLAQRVAAGGDPNYAMNYALTHQNSAAPRPSPRQPEQNNVRPTTLSHSDLNHDQRNAGRVLTARIDAGKRPNPLTPSLKGRGTQSDPTPLPFREGAGG